MLNKEQSFNGNYVSTGTSGTVTIPYINYGDYQEACPHCHGVGHIHCPDCKKESPCPECNGSGKKNVYQGSVYKIYWNNPYPCRYEVTCKNSAPCEEHTQC